MVSVQAMTDTPLQPLIHVNIHSHQMNRLRECLERLVQFTCMCRFVPFVEAFLALYSVQLPPLPQRNENSHPDETINDDHLL